MLESQRESTDNLKPEALPQFNGPLVRTDDEVELHRAKAGAFCLFFGMEAHRSGNTTTRGMSRRHVSTVADV